MNITSIKVEWNVPNVISMLKIILSVLLYFSIQSCHYISAALLILLAGVMDSLDGYLARRMNRITVFGKIIDPLGDKVFNTILVFSLAINYKIPTWFFLIIILRNLSVIIGGFIFIKYDITIPSAGWYGKFTGFTIGLTLSLIIVGGDHIKTLIDIMTFLSITMISLCMIDYTKRLIRLFNEKKKGNIFLSSENIIDNV